MPIGQGGADFRLLDDFVADLVCVAGPTPPREPIVSQLRSRSEIADIGIVTWRLMNMLSLNHLGLSIAAPERTPEALSEMLSLFADLSDSATERKIRGVRSVDSRPVVRRIRERSRQRRRARPGDHHHARREGIRRQRRVPAGRRAGALLCRYSGLTISPRP